MENKSTYPYQDYTRLDKDALYLFLANGVWRLLKELWILVFFFASWVMNAQGRKLLFGLFGVLLLIVLRLGYACIKYYGTKIRVAEGKLFVQENVIKRHVVSIPVEHIQVIRTRSGILHQLVSMQQISFDTLAENKKEVELYMNEREVEALLAAINRFRSQALQLNQKTTMATDTLAMAEATTATVPPPYAASHEIKYSIGQIMVGAASQNVLKKLLVCFAFVSPFLSNLRDLLEYKFFYHYFITSIDQIEQWTGSYFTTQDRYLITLVLGIPLLYLVSLGVYVLYSCLTKYNLTLKISRNKFWCRMGLLNRRTTEMTKDKIVSVMWKQNPIEKLLGLSTLYVLQPQNADGKRKDKIVVQGWRPSAVFQQWWWDDVDLTCLTKIPMGVGYAYHNFLSELVFRAIIVGLGFAVLGFLGLNVLALGLVWTAIVFMAGFIIDILKQRRSSLSVHPRFLIFREGLLSESLTSLPLSMVESVRLSQTIFQERTHKATLFFYTKGHTYAARSLPLAEAQQLRNYILYKQVILSRSSTLV